MNRDMRYPFIHAQMRLDTFDLQNNRDRFTEQSRITNTQDHSDRRLAVTSARAAFIHLIMLPYPTSLH